MNILITGPIGGGKSTLVHHALENLRLKAMGFRTLPVFNGSTRIGFAIHPWDREASGRLAGTVIGYKRISPCIEAFEEEGVRYLREALDGAQLIVMDELGLAETQALQFQAAVFQCLASDVPVVAVLRDASSPFLDRVRTFADGEILWVEPSVRDRVQSLLSDLLTELDHREGE